MKKAVKSIVKATKATPKAKEVVKAVAPVVAPVAQKKPSIADVKSALDVLGRAGGFKISREILTASDVIL